MTGLPFAQTIGLGDWAGVGGKTVCERGVVQVWLGFSQSLRSCMAGLTLNVDVASSAFVTAQPLVDYVARAAGVRPDMINNGLAGNQLRSATKASLNLQAPPPPPPPPHTHTHPFPHLFCRPLRIQVSWAALSVRTVHVI